MPLPATAPEAITMLAHYYRGEVTRMISWRDRLIRISEVFAGHHVGLEPIDDALWAVHFYRFKIGDFDERNNEFF